MTETVIGRVFPPWLDHLIILCTELHGPICLGVWMCDSLQMCVCRPAHSDYASFQWTAISLAAGNSGNASPLVPSDVTEWEWGRLQQPPAPRQLDAPWKAWAWGSKMERVTASCQLTLSNWTWRRLWRGLFFCFPPAVNADPSFSDFCGISVWFPIAYSLIPPTLSSTLVDFCICQLPPDPCLTTWDPAGAVATE